MTTSAEQLQAAIDALTNAANAYNGKIADIESRMNVALQQADGDNVHIYVNSTAGDDANAGDEANPLASVRIACQRVPHGATGIIHILDDYQFTEEIKIYGVNLRLVGHGQPELTFGWVDDGADKRRLAGIAPSFTGFFEIQECDIHLPVDPPETVTSPHSSGIFANIGETVPPILAAKFSDCNFYHNNGVKSSLFGQCQSLIVVQFQGCTFPSDMAGKVRAGVGGAAVDPETVGVMRHVITDQSWI